MTDAVIRAWARVTALGDGADQNGLAVGRWYPCDSWDTEHAELPVRGVSLLAWLGDRWVIEEACVECGRPIPRGVLCGDCGPALGGERL